MYDQTFNFLDCVEKKIFFKSIIFYMKRYSRAWHNKKKI